MRVAYQEGIVERVTKSLPELISDRMADLGVESVRQLYNRLPNEPGVQRVTYETVRKLYNGEQRGTRDERVPRDLALMLEVSENEVRAALAMPPAYGQFDLPPRAQGLAPQERDVVMAVVDALLRARRGTDAKKSGAAVGAGPAEPEPAAGSATPLHIKDAEGVDNEFESTSDTPTRRGKTYPQARVVRPAGAASRERGQQKDAKKKEDR